VFAASIVMSEIDKKSKWTRKDWLATLLFVSAFACAAYFGRDEVAHLSTFSGIYFGFALGCSLLLWGMIDLENGTIKGRRRYYSKSEEPKMFVFLFLFKIVLPSICGFVIAGYYAFVY
jgi:hypothetical protein